MDRQSAWTWVIDPIDGTLNYASDLPLFAVMAAALVAMGCINVAAVQLGAWGGRTERT
jgi:fructose-1,6-bisphosphatase/inositol monophosphatase family enzyme